VQTVRRSIHYLTCSDLLSPLCALGSHPPPIHHDISVGSHPPGGLGAGHKRRAVCGTGESGHASRSPLTLIFDSLYTPSLYCYTHSLHIHHTHYHYTPTTHYHYTTTIHPHPLHTHYTLSMQGWSSTGYNAAPPLGDHYATPATCNEVLVRNVLQYKQVG
jgi:hypothetical protein